MEIVIKVSATIIQKINSIRCAVKTSKPVYLAFHIRFPNFLLIHVLEAFLEGKGLLSSEQYVAYLDQRIMLFRVRSVTPLYPVLNNL